MGVCVVIQSGGVSVTGSDVTPNAMNWTNISASRSVSVTATTNTVTVAAIDTPITLHATQTGLGEGRWVKNGVGVGAFTTGSHDVTVSVGDTLAFTMRLTGEEASFATGTVTVTNTSDGGAAIDTFTYSLEVY